MSNYAYLAIILVIVLQTACQTVVSNPCGALFTYSKAFMAEAANEYGNLPPAAKTLIDDYEMTRASIRACTKKTNY